MTEDRATYEVPGEEVRREARLPYSDPDYSPPTPNEVRALLRKAGWTGSQAARRAGVDGRTIRKWTGGERDIPYSAWRLLLIEAGFELEGRPRLDRSAEPTV